MLELIYVAMTLYWDVEKLPCLMPYIHVRALVSVSTIHSIYAHHSKSVSCPVFF